MQLFMLRKHRNINNIRKRNDHNWLTNYHKTVAIALQRINVFLDGFCCVQPQPHLMGQYLESESYLGFVSNEAWLFGFGWWLKGCGTADFIFHSMNKIYGNIFYEFLMCVKFLTVMPHETDMIHPTFVFTTRTYTECSPWSWWGV